MSHQPSAISELQFLKLGGSLITDKSQPSTARPEVLARLAEEIAQFREERPDQHLLLGHGSGSFAHVPAKEHNTRAGARSPEEWRGFIEVWAQAAQLNQMVIQALQEAGLPALAFPPSAGATAKDGEIFNWDLSAIQAALEAGLLPVVYGDVAFDSLRGSTILSTENLFAFLAAQFEPQRILLAGDEAGIYVDYPGRQTLLPTLTPSRAAELGAALGGAKAADVTGGMAGKVRRMFRLLNESPALEIRIFSGLEAGSLQSALTGEAAGTLLQLD